MGRFTNTSRTETARFRLPGASITGVVSKIVDAPVPEFVDGRIVGPKFDAHGKVVEQADVTLIVEDGTETVLHTRGESGGVAIAIAQALQAIGADDLAVDDTLTVTYVADEDTDGDFATKVYEAKVVKPKSGKKA